jgi:hypothetical protein
VIFVRFVVTLFLPSIHEPFELTRAT